MKLELDRTVAELVSRLPDAGDSKGPVKVEGTWGSFARLLTVYISKQLGRPILYICPHIDDADNAVDDLKTFGGKIIETFPAWEDGEDLADATDEIRTERLRLVHNLSLDSVYPGNNQIIIPTSVQALCQPIPKPEILDRNSLSLQINKIMPPEKVTAWLIDNEFERVESIDLPGQFARRGGIIDIYAPLSIEEGSLEKQPANKPSQSSEAIRVEFFGDVIETIRQINLDTQRSSRQIKSLDVVSMVSWITKRQRELFVNILPRDTIIILEEPSDIEEVARVFLERLENKDHLYSWAAIHAGLKKFTQLYICKFATSEPSDFLKMDISSVQQYQHKKTTLWSEHKESLEQLIQQAKHGKTVLFYCEAEAEIKRVGEIIEQINKKVPAKFKLLRGFIHGSFVLNSLNTIIISHHELFGQYTLRRRQRPVRISRAIDTLADLQQGDYVVHASYGIGRFTGVETIQRENTKGEYLTIEYDGGVRIQVSVSNIVLIQKYIGTSVKRPRLSKVGSKKWQRQKEKVATSVEDLARQMLEVQAERQMTNGIKFADDSNWQVEFEESFAYQETADQIAAAEQIKADMQQVSVMDRLLCGDVGYGKTELAMRAAFKAVDSGKQVAVLVPTTVLSVQHSRTFTERFADFPICIEFLNRFKTTGQASDIIERTKQGKVDILIGTHRLISNDVGFKDLGLLIIDEEQRFGVEHKEKLKGLRTNVDILTMTATPIPRTLHMSLLGLRDISSLATAPLDRRSIVTTVAAYDRELIKKGILRELNRQGQVFFLHNRVGTIEKKAWEIRRLLSDAKVAIAHGQMSKSELEKAMIDFIKGEVHVLVCTTIIESGLDIPNANTIFIDSADRFGLAQLHQLRGRVGRYKHRAYAYLLLPRSRTITPIAARRLKAIEEYSHLGAGFRIALRDLEIRGAGNILGADQSGHIQIVGYQMYCKLLADAVRKLNNEPIEPIPTAVIDLGFDTYIPKNYIPLNRYRIDVYRKIALAKNQKELKQISDELIDIYGPVPDEVELLLELANLRIGASKHDIKAIVASGYNLMFSFAKTYDSRNNTLFAKLPQSIRIVDPKTVCMCLERDYSEPRILINFLQKIFRHKESKRIKD